MRPLWSNTALWPNCPPKHYGVIYADPPWSFRAYSDKTGLKKSPQAHYSCMNIGDIYDMQPMIDYLAAPNCVLFLWGTFPMLPEAVETVRQWGFDYKTGGAWHKKTKHDKTAFGTGYIFRSASEPFLVATRGKPTILNRSTRNLVEAKVREHSRKPDMVYDMISELWEGPYIELFARNTRDGWDSWGNEVGKHDETGER